MTDKVSILICGKLNRTSIENLHNYTKYKEVIICCWRDDNLKILDGIDSFDNVKILIIEPVHESAKKFHGYNILMDEFCHSFYYQAVSIASALRCVNTQYVIKTRSDESFSNLEAMVDKYFSSGEKYLSSNIFWKKCDWGHYHIGDHVFMAKTKDLVRSYDKMNFFFSRNISPMLGLCSEQAVSEQVDLDLGADFSPALPVPLIPCNPEIITACFYLHSVGVKMSDVLDKTKRKKILYDNFQVINVNELGEYTITVNSENKKYLSDFPEEDEQIINNDIDEVFFTKDINATHIAKSMKESGLHILAEEIMEAQK